MEQDFDVLPDDDDDHFDSVVFILTCFFISPLGCSIRFNTPMLFVMGFCDVRHRGTDGLPLGFNYSDLTCTTPIT